MRTDEIQVRTFIEGIYVPKVSTISVTSTATEEAHAVITMPAIPALETEELKRATVHIFWSNREIREQVDVDQWPVLFEGEIVGDTYDKGVGHRSQSFICDGYANYFKQVYYYYYDMSTNAGIQTAWTQQISVALGNDVFVYDAKVSGGNLRQRMVDELRKSKESYQSFVKTVFRQAIDTNYFFRDRDERLKLAARFVSARDEDVEQLISRSKFSESLGQDILVKSGQATMFEVLEDILALFRYQIIHNPQPIYAGGRAPKTAKESADLTSSYQASLRANLLAQGIDDEEVIIAVDGQLTDDDITKIIADIAVNSTDVDVVAVQRLIEAANTQIADASDPQASAEGLEKDDAALLAEFLILPDTLFSLPPRCNVFFPRDQTALAVNRQYLKEYTRALGFPETVNGMPFKLVLAPPDLASAIIPQKAVEAKSEQGFFPPVTAKFTTGRSGHYGPRDLSGAMMASGRVGADGKPIMVAVHPEGRHFHYGLDMSAGAGTPVYAFDDGVVTYAAYQGHPANNEDYYEALATGDKLYQKLGYGLHVRIAHGTGLETRYAHLQHVDVVAGEEVKRGQKIGAIGSSGRSTGPHLHFETLVNGRHQDPEPLVKMAKEGGVTAAAATVTGTPITEMKKEERFLDYNYLSPEERDVGIIPFFDRETTRANAFMAHENNTEDADTHYRHMLNAEFFRRRHESRSINTLSMPFNPSPVAGFPALIIDRVRSLIGKIESIEHTIAVGGGQGSATTSVQLSSPRYWDEGDPYYWEGGDEGGEAHFPVYYLKSLIPTNSAEADVWWENGTQIKRKTRPIDEFYMGVLGTQAIDYQYATRQTNMGVAVAYNKAINGRGDEPRNTLVGHYYWLAERDPHAANDYASKFTKRHGINERELMTEVLGAKTGDKLRYTGHAFRVHYQTVVDKLNRTLVTHAVFRG